jgi:hypothetical protein
VIAFLLAVIDVPLLWDVMLPVEWKLFACLCRVLPKVDVLVVRNPPMVGNP